METVEQQLATLRARIDAIDETLAQQLVTRMGIIAEVGALKAQHWPGACHIRPGREGQMHRAVAERFSGTQFSPLVALSIWRQLIGGSTHLESPLNITYLSDHRDHLFFAREYFGLQIGARAAPDLAQAIETIRAKKSNLLILPTPTAHDWWQDHARLTEAGLAIFAQLPISDAVLPEGSIGALALAVVTPENSGDDISYFVTREGRLEMIDGFTTTHHDAIFLGAHPRPIRF